MSAGCTDSERVGEYDKPVKNLLGDIPKFTPTNCNFFKQTISQREQADLLSSNDRTKRTRLTTDRVHPIYDRRNF